MKRLLFLVNIFFIIALLLAYVSPYTAPTISYIPQLIGLGYVYILCVNLAFVVLWLFFKRSYAVYSLIVILLGVGFVQREYKWSNQSLGTNKKGLKIITYNVRSFAENPQACFTFIAKQNADILCFQEYLDKNYLKYGKKKLRKLFPHHYNVGEVAIFSKYPLKNRQNIVFPKGHYVAGIRSDVILGKDTIRFVNVHLESNQLNSQDKHDIESLIRNKKRNTNTVKNIIRKLKKSALHRAKQVEVLSEVIEKSPYQIVLCGDFNDVPMSYSYQQMRKYLDDSFVESGKGWGKTFVEKSINVRIDYVFSNLQFGNHQVAEVNFSDHKPVSVFAYLNLE
ncbi:MAG: endonuclease/exonuclease/phosphatase family protein [Flavobacteriaceae bacterium]|nr:endonuclease/exonuclease/phosphatase family protein [Flavobacteriaceae bacterium]